MHTCMYCDRTSKHPLFCEEHWEDIAPVRRPYRPISDWGFFAAVVILTLILLFSLAQLVRAEPDTDAGILDSMVGYRVQDYQMNTDYLVTPSPLGGYVVKDANRNNLPVYRVRDGRIYNYRLERQRSIFGETDKTVPK